MKRRRAVIGTLLLGFSLWLLVSSGSDSSLPFGGALISQGLPAAIGLGVTIAGLMMISRGEFDMRLPTVEDQDIATPGGEFEQQLAELSESPNSPDEKSRYREMQQDITDRLRELTVSTLVETYSIDEQRAHELLDSGDWCEDPHAIAFFTGTYPDRTPATIRYRANSNFVEISPRTQAEHVIDVLGEMDAGELDAPHAIQSSAETGGETA
jgi:hypothetical protein